MLFQCSVLVGAEVLSYGVIVTFIVNLPMMGDLASLCVTLELEIDHTVIPLSEWYFMLHILNHALFVSHHQIQYARFVCASTPCWFCCVLVHICVSKVASMNLNSSFSVFSPGVVQLSQFIIG